MLQQQTHEERRGLAPVLVLLKGQPGCGKSTLATALAAKLRWPLIDKDDARSPCQHLVAAHPTLDFNQLAYDVMWRVCERQLCCGLSIVVDCPLARRELFDRAAGLADQYGSRLALVELEPGDSAVWRQWIERRGQQDAGTEHEHKPGSWADVEGVLARNNGCEEWSAAVDIPMRCTLDSTGTSTEQQLRQVLSMLEAGQALPWRGAQVASSAPPHAEQQTS